jgi:hypothetical protein
VSMKKNSWFIFVLYLWFKIREGRTQTIGECLHREYRIVCHVLKGDFSKDFYEVNINTFKSTHFHSGSLYFIIQFLLQGGRAILIDKDQNPRVRINSYIQHIPIKICF